MINIFGCVDKDLQEVMRWMGFEKSAEELGISQDVNWKERRNL